MLCMFYHNFKKSILNYQNLFLFFGIFLFICQGERVSGHSRWSVMVEGEAGSQLRKEPDAVLNLGTLGS